VAYFYEEGIGAEINLGMSLAWYRRALAAGDSRAAEKITELQIRPDINRLATTADHEIDAATKEFLISGGRSGSGGSPEITGATSSSTNSGGISSSTDGLGSNSAHGRGFNASSSRISAVSSSSSSSLASTNRGSKDSCAIQ
jgi:hypothetical protein